MSRSSLKAALSADDVEHLVKWYRDSYDEDWRPDIYVRNWEEEQRQKIEDLYRKHVLLQQGPGY